MQPFENGKIYKEMYSVRMPDISWLILTFLNRCISVKTGLNKTKLGILLILVCSFWLCGSIVAYPIIYRLVPSPSRFENRQCRTESANRPATSLGDLRWRRNHDFTLFAVINSSLGISNPFREIMQPFRGIIEPFRSSTHPFRTIMHNTVWSAHNPSNSTAVIS